MNNKHILITGGTGGIGKQLLDALQTQHNTITVHGRNKKILADLKKRYNINTIACDIATDKGIEEIYRYALKNPIDILINNAGVLYMQDFTSADKISIDTTIDVNVRGLIHLTNKILPLMQKQSTPARIVNIGSIAGDIAMPFLATYCASKFAVKGFSESLHRELFDSNVNITYIAPRAVDTPMVSVKEHRVFKAMFSKVDSPEYVAKLIVGAIEKNSSRLTIGLWENFSVILNSVIPSQVDLFFWVLRKRIKKAFDAK